jgi:hypothetical protein
MEIPKPPKKKYVYKYEERRVIARPPTNNATHISRNPSEFEKNKEFKWHFTGEKNKGKNVWRRATHRRNTNAYKQWKAARAAEREAEKAKKAAERAAEKAKKAAEREAEKAEMNELTSILKGFSFGPATAAPASRAPPPNQNMNELTKAMEDLAKGGKRRKTHRCRTSHRRTHRRN